MNRSALLWVIAFLLTASVAMYQRMTGPTYPLTGSLTVGGEHVAYRFDRSHGGDGDHEVIVRTGNPDVSAVLDSPTIVPV